MAKSRNKDSANQHSAIAASLVAPTNNFDPALAALFASSAGPVNIPVKPAKPVQRADTITLKPVQPVQLAPVSDDSSSDDDSQPQSEAEPVNEGDEKSTERPHKRRKLDVNEDLESQYLNRLMLKEEQERQQKQQVVVHETVRNGEDEEGDSDLDSNLQDISDSELEEPETDTPKHESLVNPNHEIEAEKHKRTAFLGNVAVSAIKSKSDKKTLIRHLKTALDEKFGEKIESIRFRSTAFVSDAGPKRATFAKKELMEGTMKSTNAYVVLSSEAAVRKVTMKLNGTMVLDRHLRVDNLAQPSKTDNRRCVFVGNLSFVDEATSTEATGEGEKAKKRAREPADVEEGLWRTFGKVGKVESVRVVRDKETRVSKGIAYVQFENENAVEAALLLNEKKFPPLLPRILRVTRAKKEMKLRKRDGPMNGAGRPRVNGRMPKHMQRPMSQNVVFEGHRATSTSGGGSRVQKKSKEKRNNRSSKRAAAFKASGGKKKRDST